MADLDGSPDGLREALMRVARALIDLEDRLPEDQYDALVDEWAALCPHPGETDILFWPDELGLCRDDEVGSFEMSPEEMVEYALSWEPRTVAMRVRQRSGGPSVGYYLYQLEAPDTPKTQVATGLETAHEPGAVVAVALKGARLPDGSRVATSFEHRVSSCGRILGPTDRPVGTRLDEAEAAEPRAATGLAPPRIQL